METKNISNISQKEKRIRKTTIIFGSLVIALTYLWAIGYACYYILDMRIDFTIFSFVQMGIYLFVLVTLGCLISIAIYDGKRMKTSSKESMVIFAISTLIAIVVLVFSTMQLPKYIAILSGRAVHSIAAPGLMFITMVALLLAVSYNSVFIKNKVMTNMQRLSQPIGISFGALLGLMVLPLAYGIAQNWLSDTYKEAFDSCVLGLIIVLFQLVCILMVIKIISVCFNKQTKQIVAWSVMLLFAMFATIWTRHFHDGDFWWAFDKQNILSLILSSAYMMIIPIIHFCLSRKERQIKG